MADQPGTRAGSPAESREAISARYAPDSLFSMLNERELIVLGRRWKIEVFSVCELGGFRYVQLAVSGLEEYMLTLRVGEGVDVRQLIPRLLTWLARPASSGEILDVC